MRRFKSKAGSALIWALAVALILTIVLAAGMGVVQRQQNMNVQQHIENQAYYSAMSVTQAVIGWFSGTSYDTLGGITAGQEEQVAFINWITAPGNRDEEKPLVVDVPFNPNDPAFGSYSIFVSSNYDGSEISFRTVATHADATETVIGTLSQTSTADLIEGYKDPWAPIQVQDPPASLVGNTLKVGTDEYNVNNLPDYSSVSPLMTDGVYKITSGTAGRGSCSVLVAAHSSATGGTININSNNIGMLIIKGNTIVQPDNGVKLVIGDIVIESGGVLTVQNGTSLTRCDNIFIMPGGRFMNNNNSTWDLGANVYMYASDLPNPADIADYINTKKITWPSPGAGFEFPAYMSLGEGNNKANLTGEIIIQPATPPSPNNPGGPISYWPIVANLNNVNASTGSVVHIPREYPQLVKEGEGIGKYACTASWPIFESTFPPGFAKGLSPPLLAQLKNVQLDENPFCPHFLAKAEEDIEFEDIVWGGSYSRG